MLYDLHENEIKRIPKSREVNYQKWRKKLSNEEYNNAVSEIKRLINGKDNFNSSYLPGKNWLGTPLEPLYHACGKSEEQSGYFFGLLVWEVIIKDSDVWYFKSPDKDSDDPLGKVYFRKK